MIKCTHCGKFIPYSDLDSGKAKIEFTPDNEFDAEETLYLCRKCSLEEYMRNCSKVVSTWPSWKRNIALTHNERQLDRFNND